MSRLNPRLVYVSHKGFLPGPYEHRTALDEVVQMMGGLAYMTGPEGRPLRAGASVNDIMGGMFGAIGALAALAQRDKTGQGQEVHSALFENNVFLVAQHMMQFAVTGQPAAPMPSRISAWGVYDVFDVAGGEQIFLAAVSDTQWAALCREFAFADLLADARLRSNNDRVRSRDWLMPLLRTRFAALGAAELAERFDAQRPALCAHHPPAGPVRRPASGRQRRPGAGEAARRCQQCRPCNRHPHAAAAADAGRQEAAAARRRRRRWARIPRHCCSGWAMRRRRSMTCAAAA